MGQDAPNLWRTATASVAICSAGTNGQVEQSLAAQVCTVASAVSRGLARRVALRVSRGTKNTGSKPCQRRPLTTLSKNTRRTCRRLHHQLHGGPRRLLRPYEVHVAVTVLESTSAVSSNATHAPCAEARGCCGLHLLNLAMAISRNISSAAHGASPSSIVTSASARSATFAASHPPHLLSRHHLHPHLCLPHPLPGHLHLHPCPSDLGPSHRRLHHRLAHHQPGLHHDHLRAHGRALRRPGCLHLRRRSRRRLPGLHHETQLSSLRFRRRCALR